jgi:hypothetical protein
MFPVPSWLHLADRSSRRTYSSNRTIEVRGQHITSTRPRALIAVQAEGTTTPPVRWEGVTTPPIPSSSPYVPDTMDISPLPHKAPFSFLAERCLPSTTDTEENMISPCELAPPPQFPTHQLQIPRPVSAAE